MYDPKESAALRQLRKTPTGISGFDEVTGGGVPQGRPTLICGGPGIGKTLFGMEFLVRGARDFALQEDAERKGSAERARSDMARQRFADEPAGNGEKSYDLTR